MRAGGPTDILARVLGAGMAKVVGEQVYIENRTGAGGNIATEATARAEPDGYTTQVMPMSGPINESLFKNFKIKFAEHLEPIGGIAQTGLVLLVHPSLDVKSVPDLIKLGKAKPGEVLYASAGAGTATHLAPELFNSMAGTKLMPVHYRGGGETLKDLLSGEMKLMFSTIPPVLPFVKDGRLRGIATTGPAGTQFCRSFQPSRRPACRATRWCCGSGSPRPRVRRGRCSISSGGAQAGARHAGCPGRAEQAGVRDHEYGTERVRQVLCVRNGQMGQAGRGARARPLDTSGSARCCRRSQQVAVFVRPA